MRRRYFELLLSKYINRENSLNKIKLYRGGYGAGLFYLIGDILGGLITPEYNYIKNAVSELIQAGAENRIFLSSFLFVHAWMIILFSAGILIHHPFHKNRALNIAGILLLIVGLAHLLSSSIFPQDPVGAQFTSAGIIHLVLVGITVIFIIIIMPLFGLGLTHEISRKSFRIFTFISLAIILIFGICTPIAISKGIEVIGLTERITAYTFYIWMFVLAHLLLKEKSKDI
jgi:hypothetical protein